MNDNWDEYAKEWDKNNDAIFYSEKVFESLVQTTNIDEKHIMDFGCGTGLLTEKMSPMANKIVALDLSEKMIGILNSKTLPNVTAISGQLSSNIIQESSAFSEKFNLIVASSVFGFSPNYISTLKHLKSMLLPDGILIQWDWLSPENDPQFGLSQVTIENSYISAGLKKSSITTPFSIHTPSGKMPVVMGVSKNA